VANQMKWARWLLVLAGISGIGKLDTLETVTRSFSIQRRALGVSSTGTMKQIEQAERALLRMVKRQTSAKPIDKPKLGSKTGKSVAP
jgi:hypothetical protein